MEIVGGIGITIVSLLLLAYAVISKVRLYSLLLILFYIYIVIGHAKTGIMTPWVLSDFTYIISNILFFIYVLKSRKINFLFFFSVLILLLSFAVNTELYELSNSLDRLYKVLSSVVFIFLFSILIIKVDGGELGASYSNFFAFSFFAIFFLFLIQALLPYHGIDIQVRRVVR